MIKPALSYLALATLMAGSSLLMAFSSGPDPRLTNAPGDDVCRQCHGGTALNGGPGSVRIKLPGSNSYTPGVTQRISVELSDPAQKRWGFEFTARLNSDLKNGQAGSLAKSDNNTQVICENGSNAPCSAPGMVQFVTHTSAGTRNGTSGGVTFEFDWTPPAADMGKVTFYVAGNAAMATEMRPAIESIRLPWNYPPP